MNGKCESLYLSLERRRPAGHAIGRNGDVSGCCRFAREGATNACIPFNQPSWCSYFELLGKRHICCPILQEVRWMPWWVPRCSVGILGNSVGGGSRLAGGCETHCLAGPSNFRQLDPSGNVSSAERRGTSEFQKSSFTCVNRVTPIPRCATLILCSSCCVIAQSAEAPTAACIRFQVLGSSFPPRPSKPSIDPSGVSDIVPLFPGKYHTLACPGHYIDLICVQIASHRSRVRGASRKGLNNAVHYHFKVTSACPRPV